MVIAATASAWARIVFTFTEQNRTEQNRTEHVHSCQAGIRGATRLLRPGVSAWPRATPSSQGPYGNLRLPCRLANHVAGHGPE